MFRPSAFLLPTAVGQTAARLFGRDRLCAPIVIGATGGSGTRAVRAVLEKAGIFMGANVNNVGDAMDYEPLLDELINQILDVTHTLDYEVANLPAHLGPPALKKLRDQVRVYLQDRPRENVLWGWKNPRSMYILPLIHALFPQLYFVHVVRDGRDMAISPNQWQFKKHYKSLFGQPASEDETAVASCALWGRANLAVSEWGPRHLGQRYIRVRLEDLCAKPLETTAELLSRLDMDPALAETASRLVETPPSLRRWRELPVKVVEDLERVSGEPLQRFGYLVNAPAQSPTSA